MTANGVVAGAPAENVPATDQLVRKRLGILEDFPLECGVERLRERVVSTGADCSHRLPNSEVITGVYWKSTRLNSSHVAISYAVFCLTKQIKYTRLICVA